MDFLLHFSHQWKYIMSVLFLISVVLNKSRIVALSFTSAPSTCNKNNQFNLRNLITRKHRIYVAHAQYYFWHKF